MKYWLVLCAFCSHLGSAWADSWELPKTRDYYSSDSSYLLRVVPTIIPAKYWEWQAAKPKKRSRYSPQDTTIVHCYATLFHRVQKDLVPVWKQDLVNRIAPMHALVSNDGRYVVTLDNWASLGYGVDVVVVYDHQGAMRKRTNLESLSPYPLNQYRITVSSLWWRCGEQFVDNTTIELCFRDRAGNNTSKQYPLPELTAK